MYAKTLSLLPVLQTRTDNIGVRRVAMYGEKMNLSPCHIEGRINTCAQTGKNCSETAQKTACSYQKRFKSFRENVAYNTNFIISEKELCI